MPKEKRYRKNVAAVVLDQTGLILACQRADEHKSWQLPQGGIDPGESTETAIRRELREEIGTSEINIIGSLADPIRYDWPMEYAPIPGFHGQEQHYFLVSLGPNEKIDLQAHAPYEFQDFCWVTVQDFFSRTIGFKKDAYRKALAMFIAQYPDTIVEK